MHTKKRQEETCERLSAVLGDSCISCEFQLADDFQQGFSSLHPAVAEELFCPEICEGEVGSQALSPDMTKLKKANVVIDNSLSPSQTLLQIHCVDQKGLLYDIMRTLKDYSIQVYVNCTYCRLFRRYHRLGVLVIFGSYLVNDNQIASVNLT